MTTIGISEYFAQHRLRKIGKGSGVIAYGNKEFVVKVRSAKRQALSFLMSEAARKGTRGKKFSDARQEAWRLSAQLQQKQLEEIDNIKKGLGGCVLDFEVPDQLRCRVWHFWVIPEADTFYRPVVQRRMPGEESLTSQLKQFARAQDSMNLERLIDLLYQLNREVIRRGMYMGDPLPENYYCVDGGLRIADLGSLWSSKSRVVKVFSGEEAEGYIERNYGYYARLISSGFAPRTPAEKSEVERLLQTLKRHFNAFCGPRLIKTMWGKARPVPVPDVFPIEV